MHQLRWQPPKPRHVLFCKKKGKINEFRDTQQHFQTRLENKKYSEIAKQAASQPPPKTEIILQHDMSHSILTARILAHLNNITEPSTFNLHLNYLLKKNNSSQTTIKYHIKYILLPHLLNPLHHHKC